MITVTVMWALAEMAAEHPAAGSFGLYAEMYVHPWAGFAVRYSYWLCLVFVIGSEVVAAAIYCRYWCPASPVELWIVGFPWRLLLRKHHRYQEFWQLRILVRNDQSGDRFVVFLILGAALIFRDWISEDRQRELHGAWRIFSERMERRRLGRNHGSV